jgi:hypothetical protein
MTDKYCGVCGATSRLRLHKTLPDGEKCYICKDEAACDKHFSMKDIVELERAEMAEK